MTYHIPKTPTKDELDYIDEYFDYNPLTGQLFRFKKKLQLFREVGALNNGYLVTRVNGREIYNHHICWYLYHKKWPVLQIDHRDRCRSNNKIDNLFEVTGSEQNKNKTYPKHNKIKDVDFE